MKKHFRRIATFSAFLALTLGTPVAMNFAQQTLEAKAAQGDVITTWTDGADDYTGGYKEQTATIDGRNWLMTTGQKDFFGANKDGTHESAYMKGDALNAAKAVDSTWTESKAGIYGIIAQSKLENVNSIEFSYSGGKGNSDNTKVYLAYSSSLSTVYNLVPLTEGTQGSIPGTSKTINYSFATVSSAYYAVLFETPSYSRFDSATINFIEGESATGTISIENAEQRVRKGETLNITPTLGGIGTLSATIEDESIATVSTNETKVMINALEVGTTTITISYGGTFVNITLEVFDPYLVLNHESLTLKPQQEATIVANSVEFQPISYTWSKTDANNSIIITSENTNTVTVFATDFLGTAVIHLEATDGTITKTINLTVIVREIAEGTYTISTNSLEYKNPMDVSLLTIAKSNVELENLTFSNINNTRLNAGPNDSKTITIGGNAYEGGEFTLTLPEGLVATDITFNGIIVDNGKKPILKINEKLNFKYSGKTSETLKPYANTMTISTLGTSRIWVSSIEIVAKTSENAALDFGTYFLGATSAECASLNVLSTTWNNIKDVYNSADVTVQAFIKASAIDNEGNDLEKALGRYQYIVAKYEYDDFINGESSAQEGKRVNEMSNNNISAIVVISTIGLSAILGYYFINKKKSLA